MPQYMIASYLPDDFDPSTMTEAAIEAIHALNREINAAGAERFACGLYPASTAKSMRKANGKVVVTDGPYIETKEHVGGLQEIPEDVLGARMLQIQRKTPLVGVEREEEEAVGVRPVPMRLPRDIAAVRLFDLDDIRPQPCQHLAA